MEIAVHTGMTSNGTGTVAAGSSIGQSNGNSNGSSGSSGSSGSNGSGSSGSGNYDPFGGSGSNGSGSGNNDPFGGFGFPGFGSGGSGSNGSGSSGSGTSAKATSAQQVGVVDIDTVLDYGTGEAAGTGMVLTSSGEILTNNHVVDGSTSIKVTVVSTGKTYTATVVGTDPTDDVAVIQLKNASGLQTAKIGDSSSVSVGDSVTGVGNAGGLGGTPSAAAGKVVALKQTITASDEGGGNPETLHNLIQTNAPIQAGDSGGPLYNSSDQIIGMDTAADTSGGYGGMSAQAATASSAYAIPIDTAVSIASQIESGKASSTIHIGYPALLGVSIATDTGSGALVESTVPNGPAAGAGIAAGDTITSVGGKSISSPAGLKAALGKYHPGDKVSIGWTDGNGQSHSATVTLTTGPAD
jgi:S1-C subfamily serine protease